MEKVKVSEKYSLGWMDAVRGAGLSTLSAVLTIVLTTLESGALIFDWKVIATTALGTFIAYLVKNGVFEPTKVIASVSGIEKAKKVEETIKETL